MKIKKIMIGLLSLLSLSQGVLAREVGSVGSCPLPKDFATVKNGSLSFDVAPTTFTAAYTSGEGNKQSVVCLYDKTKAFPAAITASNCSFSATDATIKTCPNPKVATDCKLYCQ